MSQRASAFVGIGKLSVAFHACSYPINCILYHDMLQCRLDMYRTVPYSPSTGSVLLGQFPANVAFINHDLEEFLACECIVSDCRSIKVRKTSIIHTCIPNSFDHKCSYSTTLARNGLRLGMAVPLDEPSQTVWKSSASLRGRVPKTAYTTSSHQHRLIYAAVARTSSARACK